MFSQLSEIYDIPIWTKNHKIPASPFQMGQKQSRKLEDDNMLTQADKELILKVDQAILSPILHHW